MRIYFLSESKKLDPYVKDFERASTGGALKEALLEALKYVNVLHSKHFDTTATN